jgi:chromatin segregation and condensation protein Rec8/ScpA/Scc1 (kleisin family)
VREGQVELNQQAAFGPIYLRKRGEGASPPTPDTVTPDTVSDIRE